MSRPAKLAVILPTVTGREEILARTREAYQRSAVALVKRGVDVELYVVKNAPTVGEAWNHGAATALEEGRVVGLHFAIDDALPAPPALLTAWETIIDDAVPSPRIVLPDGTLESCGTMGGGAFLPECDDWTPCRSSGIPSCNRRCWEDVGGFLQIHYYSDDDWTWRAHLLGYQTVVRRAYAFEHHHASPRRAEMQKRAMQDRAAWLDNAARLGLELHPRED